MCGSPETGLPTLSLRSYLPLTTCGPGIRGIAQSRNSDSHLCPYGAHSLLGKGIPVQPPLLLVGNMRHCVPTVGMQNGLHSNSPDRASPLRKQRKTCSPEAGGGESPLFVRLPKLLCQRGYSRARQEVAQAVFTPCLS